MMVMAVFGLGSSGKEKNMCDHEQTYCQLGTKFWSELFHL